MWELVMMPLTAFVLLYGQIHAEEWKTAFLPGGYSVSAPSPLKVMDLRLIGEDAPEGCRYWVTLYKSCSFVVMVGNSKPPSPPIPPDQVLANMVAGAVIPHGGNLRAQQDLVKNGWPGIEFDYVDSKGIHGRSRSYVVKNTYFQACVCSLGSDPPSDLTAKFLDSMSTADSAGRGPLKVAGPTFSPFQLQGANASARFPSQPELSDTTFGPKDHPIKMHRFSSAYGNRSYGFVYADLPDDAVEQLQDHEEDILDMLNSESIAAFEGKSRKDRFYNLGQVRVLSSTAKAGPFGAVRVDTFIKGKRMYSALAAAPEVLINGDEVKSFFDSIKLE